MSTAVVITSAVLGGTALTTLINRLFDFFFRRQDKKDSVNDNFSKLKEGVMLLMLDKIYQLGCEYVARGYITRWESDQIYKMYNAYEGLGGNGDLKAIMEQIHKLPHTTGGKKDDK